MLEWHKLKKWHMKKGRAYEIGRYGRIYTDRTFL